MQGGCVRLRSGDHPGGFRSGLLAAGTHLWPIRRRAAHRGKPGGHRNGSQSAGGRPAALTLAGC